MLRSRSMGYASKAGGGSFLTSHSVQQMQQVIQTLESRIADLEIENRNQAAEIEDLTTKLRISFFSMILMSVIGGDRTWGLKLCPYFFR